MCNSLPLIIGVILYARKENFLINKCVAVWEKAHKVGKPSFEMKPKKKVSENAFYLLPMSRRVKVKYK